MSESICDFSDLPTSQCSHCLGLGKEEPEEEISSAPRFRRSGSKGFPARYEGTCAAQGDHISEGDMIVTYETWDTEGISSSRVPSYAHEDCL